MRVTELLQSRGDPAKQSPVMRGRVVGRASATGKLEAVAPSGFPKVGGSSNLLYVLVAGYSQDTPFGPCWWGADHGNTLPALGAQCVIAFDNTGVGTVISWQGNHS